MSSARAPLHAMITAVNSVGLQHILIYCKEIKMKNLLPLPDHICRLVYIYDPTYRDVFDVCLKQLLFLHRQKQKLNDFLVEQEIDRNIFTFSSDLYIHDILNDTVDDGDISFFYM